MPTINAFQGYTFSGVMNGCECYCGDVFGGGGEASSPGQCNSFCTGDPNTTCGGVGFVQIFSADSELL